MSKVMARSRRIAARRRDGRRAADGLSPTKRRRDVTNPGVPGPAEAGHPAPVHVDSAETRSLDLMEPSNGDRRVANRRVGDRRAGERRRAGLPSGQTGLSPRVPRAAGVALALGAAGAVALHLVLFGRAKRHIGF